MVHLCLGMMMISPNKLIRHLSRDGDISPVDLLSTLCNFLGVEVPTYEIEQYCTSPAKLASKCKCSLHIYGVEYCEFGEASRGVLAKVAAARALLNKNRFTLIDLVRSKKKKMEGKLIGHRNSVVSLMQLAARLGFDEPIFSMKMVFNPNLAFRCDVYTYFGSARIFRGVGPNKKSAKAASAQLALIQLRNLGHKLPSG